MKYGFTEKFATDKDLTRHARHRRSSKFIENYVHRNLLGLYILYLIRIYFCSLTINALQFLQSQGASNGATRFRTSHRVGAADLKGPMGAVAAPGA